MSTPPTNIPVWTSSQAAEQIARSALSADLKSSLVAFVNEFPTLSFSRLNDSTIAEFASSSGAALAPSLRALLETFSLIAVNGLVQVAFDAEQAGRLGAGWYQFGFYLSPGSEWERVTMAGEPMLVVGQDLAPPFGVMAVKLAVEDDQRVFLLDFESISSKGDVPSSETTVAFPSLAELYARIERIRITPMDANPAYELARVRR